MSFLKRISSLTQALTILLALCYFGLPLTAHAISSAGLLSQADASAPAYTGITPVLNVPIPGVEFATKFENPDGKLRIPFLAQYIAGFYKYLLGVSIVAAAIMMTYGGFLYIVAASAGNVSKGKEYITDAAIGLILVFGSYAILGFIDPGYTSLKPLAVKAVKHEEFNFMEQGAGFSVPSIQAREQSSQQVSQGQLTGTSEPPDPQAANEQGGLTIAGVQEQGTRPSARIAAYCTPAGQRNNLDTYDKKIAALVKAVLGFQKICIKEADCAYVRTGFTAIPQGTVAAGIKDYPFVLNFQEKKASDRTYSETCKTTWTELTTRDGGTGGFYANFSKKGTEYDPFIPGGSCYNELDQIYKEELLANMTSQGLIGGDCGSLLSQIYKCAGGAGGQPWQGDATSLFKYINYSTVSTNPPGQSPGPDFPVWQARNSDELIKQLNANGGPKFGDIFVIGQFGKGQHNFMYTGGRADVPFDVFEMGGGGTLDGAVGPSVKINRSNGTSFFMGGMRTLPKGSLIKYIEGYGKADCSKVSGEKARTFCEQTKGKAWPVTVARPYSYTACKAKTDCQDAEICGCTALDAGKNSSGGLNPFNPDCSAKGICRKPVSQKFMQQFSLICYSDEMCPNGWNCPTSGGRCKKM